MNKKTMLKYFLFYVFTIFSAVLAVILYVKYYPMESKVINETVNKTIISEQGIEEAINGIYDSVVTVQTIYNNEVIGTGSGFIYKKENNIGYIITNNHVIKDSNEYNVVLVNGEIVNAKLLGSDEYSDIAVLSIPVNKVPAIAKLGDSDLIKIGNTVFTVGSPMGSDYSGSITRGIISAKDRTIEVEDVVTKVIQTDAAINPGNSGGPLVNMAGEVIGITSMKLASNSIEGMGFAIPINDVKVYVSYLEKGDKISRPILGVNLSNVTDRYRLYYYGINVPNNIASGVVVTEVVRRSGAEKSGLQKGDIITKIDNKNVDTISKLRYYLYQYSVGDKVSVTYIRDGKEYKTDVTLESN